MTAVPALHLQVLLHLLVSGAIHQPTCAQKQQIMQRTQVMLDQPHTTV